MIRITKRKSLSTSNKIFIRIISVLLAFVALGLLLFSIGKNPIDVYSKMVVGSIGTKFRLIETLKITVPMVMSGIAVLMAFKLRFWNIGAEGQIIMGAIAASYFALFTDISGLFLLVIMFFVSIISGGLWALIPAYFKVRYHTNETLFTLMMNYIAIGILTYLQYNLWRDPSSGGFAKIAMFRDAARLPRIFSMHIGIIIALIVVIIVFVILNYTKLGYEISVVGESTETARYAGISVKYTILKTVFMSGAIAGLCGMIQATGVNGTLAIGISGGYGFTGIIIAWISGMNTLLVPLISFFFAMLVQGASFVETAFQIPNSVADILQAMVLIFILGSEFFIKFKIEFTSKVKKERVKI